MADEPTKVADEPTNLVIETEDKKIEVEDKKPENNQPKTKIEFKVIGVEMLRKEPSEQGAGGIVYVPRKWVGHSVVLILED